MSMKNGILDLENFPREYVQLDEELLHEMIDLALKLVGLKTLVKETGISVGKILKFHATKGRRKNIKVNDLISLSNFLDKNCENEFSLDKLKTKILFLGKHKGIMNPKLPFKFNSNEGVSFIADILTDGFLNAKYRCGYTNSNPIEILNNLKFVNKIFCNIELIIENNELNYLNFQKSGKLVLNKLRQISKRSLVRCRIYKVKEKPNPAYSVRYFVTVGKFLHFLALQLGDKLYLDPSVPKFVLDLQEEKISRFLERVLINEGYIGKNVIYIRHSNYDKKKAPHLILNYKQLFKKIGCKTSMPCINRIYKTEKGETHYSWAIFLTGKSPDIISRKIEMVRKFMPLSLRKNYNLIFKCNGDVNALRNVDSHYLP